MKWLGHHIWNSISRFRNNVYFEDLDVTSETKSLVVDTNGKVSANSSMAGDITSVTLVTDSGSAVDATSDVELRISGGNAITTSGSSTTVTVNHDDTSSQASVDNGTDTLIQDITLDTYGHVTGIASQIMRPMGTANDYAQGLVLEGSATHNNTYLRKDGTWVAPPQPDDASTSASGVVELATDVECTTGTDNARAVTCSGLEAHVNARYAHQYIPFSFKANNIPSDCWVSPSQNGPEYYAWNNTHGSGETQASSGAPSAVDTSATISVDYLDHPSAFIIPQACKLLGFRGNCRLNGNDPNTLRPVLALFRAAEPSDGNTSDVTATCVAFDKYDTASGNRKNRFLMLTTSVDVDLAQGDLLVPAVGYDATANDDNGDIWGSFTLILATKLTT